MHGCIVDLKPLDVFTRQTYSAMYTMRSAFGQTHTAFVRNYCCPRESKHCVTTGKPHVYRLRTLKLVVPIQHYQLDAKINVHSN